MTFLSVCPVTLSLGPGALGALNTAARRGRGPPVRGADWTGPARDENVVTAPALCRSALSKWRKPEVDLWGSRVLGLRERRGEGEGGRDARNGLRNLIYLGDLREVGPLGT